MSNYTNKTGLLNGGKGYKPPYKGHEAMCVVKDKMVSGSSGNPLIGKKKATQGKEIHALNQSKGRSGVGKSGYQANKVKGK